MAHSMGGNILLRSARTKVCWFDRIILSAPMIDIMPELMSTPWRRYTLEALTLAGFGDLYVPGGKPESDQGGPFENNGLTSDPLRHERVCDILKVAPWLGIGSPTIGWAQAASRSIAQMNAFGFASSIRVPVLIVAAGNDTVVSTRAIERFATQLRIGRHLVIAGAQHELLQERDEFRDQFWAAFDAYVPGSNRTLSDSHVGL
jgi:lysophospholipase